MRFVWSQLTGPAARRLARTMPLVRIDLGTFRAWRIGCRAKRLSLQWSIMVNFTRRRIRNLGLTAMAVAAVWLWTRAQERGLGHRHSQGLFAAGDGAVPCAVQRPQKAAVPSAGQFRRLVAVHIYAGIGAWAFAPACRDSVPTGVLNSALAVFISRPSPVAS